MNESHYDPPLPWESADAHAAQQACYDLIDRATEQRDTVQALAWLSACLADEDARRDATGILLRSLTEEEWPTYMVWREQTAAHLVPVMVAKHSRGQMGLVRLAEGRQTGIPSKEKSASLPCTSPIDAGVAA